LLAEAQKLLQTQKLDEAHAALDKALALPGLAGEQLLEVHATKARCYFAQQDFEKARDSCQKALDAAPDTLQAREAKSLLQRAERELEKRKVKESPPAAEPKPVAANG
jgi:tetratricopeptide (TPR) repeat protein